MDKPVTPPPAKRRKLSRSGSSKPCPQELTVYSWNINGISPFIQRSITSYFSKRTGGNDESAAGGGASLRNILRIHGWPAVLLLQEIKVNFADTATLRAIKAAVRKANKDIEEPDYVVHFCLPSDNHNARGFGGKVYGVASIIRLDFSDAWVTRVRSVDWDLEGRFLIVETKATEGRPKLAIINIYAVNGTDNPYRDSDSGKITGTRHDRKLRVHELLADEFRKLQAEGFGVILAGDMNIARSTIDGHPNLRTFPIQHCINRAHFEATFFAAKTEDARADASAEDGLNMIDTFRQLHPTRRAYTYYPRNVPFGQSCDRVDMIMASQSLHDNLVAADIHETPAERGPSDHCPLYATFRFSQSLDADEAG